MHHFLIKTQKYLNFHLEKYEIILHNKFSSTIEFVSHVFSHKLFLKRDSTISTIKGGLKHSILIIGIFVCLTPDISNT